MDAPSAKRKIRPRFIESACQQIIVASPRLSISPATHRSVWVPEVSCSSSKLRRNNRKGRVLTALSNGQRQKRRVVATPNSKDCKAGSKKKPGSN